MGTNIEIPDTLIMDLLADMRAGMLAFEGYITGITARSLTRGLETFLTAGMDNFKWTRTWLDDETEATGNLGDNATAGEWVAVLDARLLSNLQMDYRRKFVGLYQDYRLLIDKAQDGFACEIIVYRDDILETADPVRAFKTAAKELPRLFDVFKGDRLYLGPETLDTPDDPNTDPNIWTVLAVRT